jgi:hypothetical protein
MTQTHFLAHPCCNTTQKLKMIWTSMMKTSSRGMCCPLSIVCGVGVFCYFSMREPIIVLYVKTIFM